MYGLTVDRGFDRVLSTGGPYPFLILLHLQFFHSVDVGFLYPEVASLVLFLLPQVHFKMMSHHRSNSGLVFLLALPLFGLVYLSDW